MSESIERTPTPNPDRPGLPDYTGPSSGLFYGIHHDVLCEFSHDINERLLSLDSDKPRHERVSRRHHICLVLQSDAAIPDTVWNEGDKLRAEGSKLWVEGDKLRAEGGKLRAEGSKLRAEGDKLWVEGSKLWVESGKLRAEGSKLRVEGDKLWVEGDKLWVKGDKLWVKGSKLWVEGDKLWVEGNKLWAESDKLLKPYRKELEAAWRRRVPDNRWNGREIVFEGARR